MAEEEKKLPDTAENLEADKAKINKKDKKEEKSLKKEKEEKTSKSEEKSSSPKKGKKGGVTDKTKYEYIIKNKKVDQQAKKRRLVWVLIVFLIVAFAIAGIIWAVLSFIEYNNFRILISREGNNVLSLAYLEDFSDATEQIQVVGPKHMDNISFFEIQKKIEEEFSVNTGAHSTKEDNFICSTFYLKNVTDKSESFTISEEMVILSATQNIDAAIRVLVIRDGVYEFYAKAKDDGTAEEAVPTKNFTYRDLYGDDYEGENAEEVVMTTPFASEQDIISETDLILEPGEAIKYTFVIWLEGWDDDTINSVLGGKIKIDFNFGLLR